MVIELKVVMISGKAESGKNFVADVMRRKLEDDGNKVLAVAFGDYVKFLCSTYFGWDGKKDDKGRYLLQHIGTGVFRQYDEDFFANRVVDLIKATGGWDYVIIPDLRFENELHIIHSNFDAVAIRVERNGFENSLTATQKLNQKVVNDPTRVDTLAGGTFTFPVAYAGLGNTVYPNLKITTDFGVFDKAKMAAYTRDFRIVSILMKPAELDEFEATKE